MVDLPMLLRAARVGRHPRLTQEAAALSLSIPYKRYRKFETAWAKPDAEEIARIASFFSLSEREVKAAVRATVLVPEEIGSAPNGASA